MGQLAPLGPRDRSVQRLRRLSRQRSVRTTEGRFVLDGPNLLDEALAARLEIEQVFVEEGSRHQSGPVVKAAVIAGAQVRTVRPGVLSGATDTTTSQGVAAVAARNEMPLGDAIAAAARAPLTLVLAGVTDPGNAGTLLRAAEAAGAATVLFCGAAVDPWNPKCVRASAGAVMHVRVAVGGEPVEVVERLAASGVRTAATVVAGGIAYDTADLRGPIALVLGNESHGVAPAITAAVDVQLSIPMVGRTESLNVAMAGSVLAFEALRQRRAVAAEQGSAGAR